MRDWPLKSENEDMIAVAADFADRVAEGDWERAFRCAEVADALWHGAFLVVDRGPGKCQAITRSYRYCEVPARPGEPYCGQHARYIRADKADA
jgi:hypothetical protein